MDRAAWISTFEEALAKAIVQIVLSRQAEQASQAVGSSKEIKSQPQAAFLACARGLKSGYQRRKVVLALRKIMNLLHHLAVQVSSQFARL